MKEYEFHEAANLFPLLEGQEFDEFCEDIKSHGQRVPVVLYEGKILDGRNRYRACMATNTFPLRVEKWDGQGDPIDYVVSLNIKRRHLTPSQLSMVSARARGFYDEQAKERMSQGAREGGLNLPPKQDGKKGPVILPDPKHGDSRDLAGKAVGVSGRMVDFATTVIKKGTPKLIKAVDDGRLAVATAANATHLSPEEQDEIAEKAHFRRNPGIRGSCADGEQQDTQRKSKSIGMDRLLSLQRSVVELIGLLDKPTVTISISGVKAKAKEILEKVSFIIQ